MFRVKKKITMAFFLVPGIFWQDNTKYPYMLKATLRFSIKTNYQPKIKIEEEKNCSCVILSGMPGEKNALLCIVECLVLKSEIGLLLAYVRGMAETDRRIHRRTTQLIDSTLL